MVIFFLLSSLSLSSSNQQKMNYFFFCSFCVRFFINLCCMWFVSISALMIAAKIKQKFRTHTMGRERESERKFIYWKQIKYYTKYGISFVFISINKYDESQNMHIKNEWSKARNQTLRDQKRAVKQFRYVKLWSLAAAVAVVEVRNHLRANGRREIISYLRKTGRFIWVFVFTKISLSVRRPLIVDHHIERATERERKIKSEDDFVCFSNLSDDVVGAFCVFFSSSSLVQIIIRLLFLPCTACIVIICIFQILCSNKNYFWTKRFFVVVRKQKKNSADYRYFQYSFVKLTDFHHTTTAINGFVCCCKIQKISEPDANFLSVFSAMHSEWCDWAFDWCSAYIPDMIRDWMRSMFACGNLSL